MKITKTGKHVSIKLTEKEYEILVFVWGNGYGSGDMLEFYEGYERRLCIKIDDTFGEGITDDK